MHHVTLDVSQARIWDVLIVDDHPLYSDALSATLETIFTKSTFEKAGTLREAMEKLDRGFQPDLVLFDLKLPDVAGISGFLNLQSRLPGTPILVISSMVSTELVAALMQAGAAGFMPKDSPAQELKAILDEVIAGRRYVPKAIKGTAQSSVRGQLPEDINPNLASLTPQQKRVMKLICAGKPNKQIAYELDLAEATVKAHITALLRRLGVQNRTQAAVMFEAAHTEAIEGANEPEVRSFLTR